MFEKEPLGRHAQLFSLLRYNDLSEKPEAPSAEDMVNAVNQYRPNKPDLTKNSQDNDKNPFHAV